METKTITDIGIILAATYDVRLVVLSLVIAVVGSYTAMDLAAQISLAQAQARLLWLTGSALALGISIWVMHFIAMLAYQLPVPITYNYSIVLISMAVAIVSSGVGLFFASRLPLNWLMLSVGGTFVGLAIIGMHFTAMAAMQLAAEPLYKIHLVVLADLWAVSLSLSALWLVFHASAKTIVPAESLRKIGSALLAGAAIDGMHYIAIAAVSFYPRVRKSGRAVAAAGIDSYVLAITIGAAALLILMLALLASFFGQRLRAEIARAEALQESEKRYQSLYDFTPDVYLSITADGTLKSVNQAGAESLGYRKEELIGQSLWRLIYEPDREQVQQLVAKIFSEKLITSETELRKVRKDGSILWERQRSQLLLDAGKAPLELRMICRDITERKQVEDALVQNAFHDPLTRLPNRALFMDRLRQAVERARRHENYLFAVLFLDLDRFKVINDSLGHLLGDQLLIGIAARLKACLRPIDTVGRLGGDEFTILLEDLEDVSDVIRLVDRVGQQLGLPFNLNGQEVFTSASIGITLSATGYDSPENLLRDADTAMYHAKSQGSARYEIFNPEMHDRVVVRLQLETDLRHAVERQEFRLQYQPIVLLETGRIIGFEALVRWQHAEYGLQNPAEFIPVAEETGLINRICQWVLQVACHQLRTWQLQLPEALPLIINVNLSSKRFAQPNLVNQINQILQETGLNATSLRLELTEDVILTGAESATTTLWQLRTPGIQLSIDNFGKGYSSLGRLQHLPINGLKIDRSFVSQMGINAANSEIVETIVALARQLGLDVTAEGVETAEQLAQLRALKCEYGQGYFFSPPLDREAAEALIMSSPQW